MIDLCVANAISHSGHCGTKIESLAIYSHKSERASARLPSNKNVSVSFFTAWLGFMAFRDLVPFCPLPLSINYKIVLLNLIQLTWFQVAHSGRPTSLTCLLVCVFSLQLAVQKASNFVVDLSVVVFRSNCCLVSVPKAVCCCAASRFRLSISAGQIIS